MKTVKLTTFECDAILSSLSEYQICRSTCFCNYKTDMCDKVDEDGNYRCKLKRAIQSIEEKLEVYK